MDALFGTAMPLAARFFIAFLVVLALIGVTAWLVRRFGANRLGNATRGRQPRLAVIDAASVDGRRRLVLIRRDNIEHLLMIGGPTDVVVETNIVRAVPATTGREPTRVSMTAETTARLSPNVEPPWPSPAVEPAPVVPVRPSRPAATDEPWLPPEPGARPRPAADSLTGLAAELSAKLGAPAAEAPAQRVEPSVAPRIEPIAPRPPVAPVAAAPVAQPEAPAAAPQADRNLAEMAQQLEAALRRAPTIDGRPPVTDPLAIPPTAKMAPRPPAREAKPRAEPKFEPKPEPKFDSKFEPKREMRPEPKFEFKPEAPTAPDKSVYDNLEEEMASLLGRPSDKS
jgi:flagellar protein FliO/FliZ